MERKLQEIHKKYLKEYGIFCEDGKNVSELEVIVYFSATHKLSERFSIEKNEKFKEPIIEYKYAENVICKDMIIKLAEKTLIENEQELIVLDYYASKVAKILAKIYDEKGLQIINCKLKFVKNKANIITLCEANVENANEKKTGLKVTKKRLMQKILE